MYFGSSAHAATITVTTTALTAMPSDCTLQDALDAASMNNAVNGCSAGDAFPAMDVINLPAGTFDISSNYNIHPLESVSIRGAGISATTIKNTSINPDPDNVLGRVFELRNLTISTSGLTIYDSVGTLTLDHVLLDAVSVDIIQFTLGVSTNFTNVRGVNGTTIYAYADVDTPGNLLIRSSEFDGGGANYPMITHMNIRANARADIENTTITNYQEGVLNQECAPGGLTPNSLYITDSMIGGGDMEVGAQNNCGHMVISKTTFHDITGAAILASANYEPNDRTNGVPDTCHAIASSHLEVYNSTLTGITVSGTYTGQWLGLNNDDITPVDYSGAITIDGRLNPACPDSTQATSTDLTVVHTTAANNTFSNTGSATIGVTNGVSLRNLRLRNNAFQGAALTGNFSATGTVDVGGNFTTATYSGPVAFASSFTMVSNFLLGPLQDNGGVALGVDGAAGRVLTMRPLAGSLLIDAAPSAGLTTDQRGTARSLMARYDIGAVEVTIAEFTADGGVYVPPVARLAETGESWIPGLVSAAGALSLSFAVFGYKLGMERRK